MINLFRRDSTPSCNYATFNLGKDKDGHFFADPTHLGQLDDFQTHKQAADELNRNLDLLADIRSAVLPLEGTDLDKNPRPEITAVTDLPLQGKSVDAVLRKSAIEARVNDHGKTITLIEELSPVHPKRELKFTSSDHSYKVVDFETTDSYSRVTFERH